MKSSYKKATMPDYEPEDTVYVAAGNQEIDTVPTQSPDPTGSNIDAW